MTTSWEHRLFDKDLSEQLKDHNFALAKGEELIYEDEGFKECENDNINVLEPNPKYMNYAIEKDDYNDDAYDKLLHAKFRLPNNVVDGYIRGTIIKFLKNNMGQAVGTRHADLNLDSIMYNVKISNCAER